MRNVAVGIQRVSSAFAGFVLAVFAFLVAVALLFGVNPTVAFASEQGSGNTVGVLYAGVGSQAEGAGLSVKDAGTEVITVMGLGEVYQASLAQGESWVGAFTPAAAGTYAFSSAGGYDTYGWLYDDQDLAHCIGSSDDSGNGNSNFRIVKSLPAGQTVYLKAQGYGGRAAEFTVSVTELTYEL